MSPVSQTDKDALFPTDEPAPFQRRFLADRDELVAARSWHEGMENRAVNLEDAETRRNMLLLLGGTFAFGLLAYGGVRHYGEDDDEDQVTDVRRPRSPAAERLGGRRLRIAGLVQRRLRSRRGRAQRLARWSRRAGARVGPGARGAAAVLRYPTLFQVLTAPEFAAGVVPIHDGTMDRVQAQARALAALFAQGQDDTAALDRCHGSGGGRCRGRRRRPFRTCVHLRQLAPPPGRRSQSRSDHCRHLLPPDLRAARAAAVTARRPPS